MEEEAYHNVNYDQGTINEVNSHIAIVSIAISLKRIADLLQGSPDKPALAEHVGACVQDAIHNATQNLR